MPKAVHDRAMELLPHMRETYGPKKAKQVAFAVATQQAEVRGEVPKGFGTPEGRREAKAKFDKPKSEYEPLAKKSEYVNPLAELVGLDKQAAEPGLTEGQKRRRRWSTGIGAGVGGLYGAGLGAAAGANSSNPLLFTLGGAGLGAAAGAGLGRFGEYTHRMNEQALAERIHDPYGRRKKASSESTDEGDRVTRAALAENKRSGASRPAGISREMWDSLSEKEAAFMEVLDALEAPSSPSDGTRGTLGIVDDARDKQAAVLTAAKRENLPKKDFALPKQKGYPIEDKHHAANALARVSQHGTPSERATVRSKVYNKFPELKESHEERTGENPMQHPTAQKIGSYRGKEASMDPARAVLREIVEDKEAQFQGAGTPLGGGSAPQSLVQTGRMAPMLNNQMGGTTSSTPQPAPSPAPMAKASQAPGGGGGGGGGGGMPGGMPMPQVPNLNLGGGGAMGPMLQQSMQGGGGGGGQAPTPAPALPSMSPTGGVEGLIPLLEDVANRAFNEHIAKLAQQEPDLGDRLQAIKQRRLGALPTLAAGGAGLWAGGRANEAVTRMLTERGLKAEQAYKALPEAERAAKLAPKAFRGLRAARGALPLAGTLGAIAGAKALFGRRRPQEQEQKTGADKMADSWLQAHPEVWGSLGGAGLGAGIGALATKDKKRRGQNALIGAGMGGLLGAGGAIGMKHVADAGREILRQKHAQASNFMAEHPLLTAAGGGLAGALAGGALSGVDMPHIPTSGLGAAAGVGGGLLASHLARQAQAKHEAEKRRRELARAGHPF